MHFSKTYAQLLLSLPPELRDNAVQYRQLKKVINQIVGELDSLGLQPEVLQEYIGKADATEGSQSAPERSQINGLPVEGPEEDHLQTSASVHSHLLRLSSTPKVVYELNGSSTKIEPQLRIWVSMPAPTDLSGKGDGGGLEDEESQDEHEGLEGVDSPGVQEAADIQAGRATSSLLWTLQSRYGRETGSTETLSDSASVDSTSPSSMHSRLAHTTTQEVVIPLVHDTEFYNLLTSTLESVSTHLNTVHSDFKESLKKLSRTIGDTSRPASVAAGFHPHSSLTTHAGSIRVKTGDMKSDLYAWREIFQLYVEAEVFESVGESTRGEWSVEENEKRLQLFAERITQRGLGDRRKFKLTQSVNALEAFLNLNLFILNIKKFSHANSEATRKILKKHAKRTALPLPGAGVDTQSQPLLALFAHSTTSSLPRILVQAIGETLLPVIPSVDDYACLICTSIAFKPIRLSCGHLFCVRCLVKMQKRNQGDCPMCRAPSVLVANRTNVDWALLNFMQDWFPIESKEKLKSNEKEAAAEDLVELGLDPDHPCHIM